MPPSPEIRTRGLCVGQNGRREQDVVDVLHALLDIDTVDTFRPNFLRRLLHYSKVTGRFPKALLVEDVVVVESSTAMTSGASSDVWRGVLRDQPVAMKVLRTTRRPEDSLRKYTKEAVIWSQLHHPNVLPFYGIYCFPHAGPHSGRMALLSPWLDAGNVVDYLRHRADVDKELLVLDIAHGLHYLHSFQPAIVHGGLKRSNIMINSAGRACLAGFGLSKPINSSPGDEVYSSGNLTAPELLFGELVQEDRPTSASRPVPSKTIESDVYAFGCVCFEIYMGKPRFWDYHIMARLLAVRNNDRCPKPSDMSDKLWESVEACWSTLPQNRPTMAQFIQSFAQGSGGNDDPESRSCDFRFKRVWDGRPNPRATFDFRQMSVGQQATDSLESGHSLPIPTVGSLEAATPGLSFNEDDIIIAVMGPTGTGKSTFINDALSAAVAPVGHGVSACTTGINVYGCRHPVFSNRRVFLVDTPGFGVGNSDEKTLENLGRWLSDTYKSKISLSGVLYFMSIGEMRMNGRDLGNMNVFQKLCGSDAFKNVAIITTGWEEVDWAGAIERERSLKTEFLKDFLAGGGHIQRYRRVESILRNAWDIVDRFDEDKRPLLIQEEMVTKKLPFWGTSAFKAVRKFKAISKKRRNSTQEPSSNP
ncbi:kinase-like domain-containing protein [Coprinopsis sp. MPI-PUGE-AT-0042]|nr:kinase-like domain-containing protein [Coprinopsis sp. MPI-PUGE-AT-0042]